MNFWTIWLIFAIFAIPGFFLSSNRSSEQKAARLVAEARGEAPPKKETPEWLVRTVLLAIFALAFVLSGFAVHVFRAG